jgi:carbonic anhydrase/acetyltransferase-like protein (isoleucine patch superfamily)
MPLLAHHGVAPSVDETVFLAPDAMVIGEVQLGHETSVWFHVVLRGDINRITIGARTNVQDGTVVHVTHDLPVLVGREVTIGHLAMIHGCTIHDRCLIGMHAIILDGAIVGEGSIVAAGAVVRERFVVPPGVLVAGVPARVVREVTEGERRGLRESADHYVSLACDYGPNLKHP